MAEQVKWYGDKILEQLRDATPDGLFDGAEMIVTEAAARAPKMTGNLAESGYAAIKGKSTYKKDKRHNKEVKPKEGQAIAAFAIFYASFVEYGTQKNSAKPFLRPTVDQLKEQLGEAVAVKMRRVFKK